MLRHAVIECALIIELADVGSENCRSAYLDGSDKMVQIICNIHQVTGALSTQVFREKPTGTAAYLLNNRGLISGRSLGKAWQDELIDASTEFIQWYCRINVLSSKVGLSIFSVTR